MSNTQDTNQPDHIVDMHEMFTDTNQASEDELEQHLLNDKVFQHILKFAPESQRELMTFELARYINALIRTEKLKLLAELRSFTGHSSQIPETEILARIKELEAEL